MTFQSIIQRYKTDIQYSLLEAVQDAISIGIERSIAVKTLSPL